jgi:hypothetical protein
MEEGRVGYSKGLVAEHIRFTKAFKNTIHVVPFLPPHTCGTNDPELLRAMMDITVWIERLQKFKMSDYYSELRVYINAYSGGLEPTIQNTQRHKMQRHIMTKIICATSGLVWAPPCRPWTARTRRGWSTSS